MSTRTAPARRGPTGGARRRAPDPLALGRRERRWRARTSDLLELVALAGLVLVVGLFLRDGGSHDLTTGAWPGRLNAVGRVAGLVAVDLLLLQLLLAARLPWVDRAYGNDRALKAHRVLGRITVPLVLVHVEALVLGYAGQEGLNPVVGWAVEPFHMLQDVPDMLTANVATLLLVVIAVTSVRAAMRKVGYERWHLVHLTAYAAVTLGLPHQLSTGTDLTASPAAHAYWIALYVGVAGALLWWRLAVPVVRSVRHRLRVDEVVQEGPDTWSVWVSGRHLEALDARAGQYLNWRFLSPGLWAFAHPWSLSRRPDGHRLRLTVRDLGDHSRAVADLRPGTRVLIEGPYGAFTTRKRTRSRVLLLAAGIGVTPVRAIYEEIVREQAAAPGDVAVVLRADTEDRLVLRDEVSTLARRGGHRVHVLTGPPVQGSWMPRGLPGRDDADRLRRLVGDPAAMDVFVCGPAVWMDLVHTSLRDAGVPRTQIHDERFAW
ncbi:MAG: ferric reductase-like transmembrane domain-containing protein [Lapillicoccus sp.]